MKGNLVGAYRFMKRQALIGRVLGAEHTDRWSFLSQSKKLYRGCTKCSAKKSA